MVWQDYKVDLPEGRSATGKWAIKKFEVGDTSVDRQALIIALTTPNRAVPPGTYTGLYRDGAVIMSDTPAEIMDHMGFISMCEMLNRDPQLDYSVLINGLGLGMVLKAMLAIPSIKRVDVVELDQELIDLVGPHYTADSRVTIWQGDAYTFKFPSSHPNHWTFAWHDIWDTLDTDNLKLMGNLKRRYARRVVWQDCWGYELLKKLKRAERAEMAEWKRVR